MTDNQPTPVEDQDDDTDHMMKIKDLIARLQSTLDRFGNTCVYIRRGGLSWGAVALNRRDDDRKHGVFELQAQHDRDMIQRAEQVQRLMADRDHWREAQWQSEKEIAALRTQIAQAEPVNR